jgi:GxxExxY protein
MKHEGAYLHDDVTTRIIRVFWDVVNELGTGFLERIYYRAMMIALPDAGLKVTEGFPMEVRFRGRTLGEFRADLVVEERVLLELKAANVLEAAFQAQAINYLRCSRLEVGLILNFGLHPGIKRVILTNDRKRQFSVADVPARG